MTSTEKERADYNIDHGGLERAANVLHEVAQMIRPPRNECPSWEAVENTTKKTKAELLEHYAEFPELEVKPTEIAAIRSSANSQKRS